MGIGRSAALNLPGNLLGTSSPLGILWVVLVDGGSVEILIVVALDTKQTLVGGELVPFGRTSGGFERHVGIDL
ncbi:hypothetical protein PtrM4_088990 [Pyrenophora tritici-repentis]|uniref:Uncharacterized protein n=1 Tax=Pyrenophora tritici-repentis TaxID=45151 RepID=A0A2W1EKL0_9PLEO|nr:PBP1 Protein interacting protein [Pyrenophora tritici-repentis]KAF7571399.1 hypothetical protein PtrM4_088990 [Pyrenophora tritici-repentis]KAI1534462.1 PBP1 Protein interacting with poly A -binding protein [Pyrenophora tritici-repentis]KAI1574473.1 PBP1 Protein interacting with poly A -binding protein [Pyrenophora tritici-repentis]KAI1583897.1 PBP1 Protein interacting with poly A -binding protein [Pyrenophora tritici-repentis]